MNIASLFERRSLLKAGDALGALSTVFARAATVHAEERNHDVGSEAPSNEVKMADIPFSSTAKVTIERRAQIVLMGINRPYVHNRIDPETYAGLAKAYYQYDHDPSLRAAVLFGHGDNFSRGIDVDAFRAVVASDRPRLDEGGTIDPLAKTTPILSKPRIMNLRKKKPPLSPSTLPKRKVKQPRSALKRITLRRSVASARSTKKRGSETRSKIP